MKTSLCRCFSGFIFALLCLPFVSFAAPPNITSQPTNQAAALGGTAVFRVTASGTQPLRYQWHFNGTNLVGRTNSALTFTNVQPANAGIYSITVTNRFGSVTSSNAVLTVLMPVSITLQPVGCTNVAGTTANFTVAADGSTPLSYRWKKNGSSLTDGGNVSGAATNNLTLSNVQDVDAASYTVVIKNVVGSITSAPAVLAVVHLPTITMQPANQAIWAGSNAVFSIAASGTPPLSYQWQFNGTNINGSTNTSLTLTNVQVAQAGNYAVLVSNAAGSILSSNAVLMVVKSGPVLVCDEVDLQAAVAAGGTITFDCDGVITLTKTLAVTKPTTLDGTGHTVTISGGNAVRVFTVQGANTLSLFNLTIANGSDLGTNAVPGTMGGNGQGGAVLLNGGTLIASNCLFLANVAQGGSCGLPTNSFSYYGNGGDGLGGAININSGSLSITNCNFIGNQAKGGAGTRTSVDIQGGTGGNAGNGFGGAVYCTTSVVQMVNCQFKTNQTIGADAYSDGMSRSEVSGGAYGGAVCELGGTVTNINGSFVGNQALASLVYYRQTSGNPGQGGACFNSGGSLVVSGTSFTSNAVAGGRGGPPTVSGPGQGGAIFSYGSLQISNCNLGYNQAAGGNSGSPGSDGQGGAVFCAGPSSINQSWFFGNVVWGGWGNPMYGEPSGTGRGGAIYNSNTVSIVGCTFSTNKAFGTACRVLYAWASSGYGGAIYNNGSCYMTNSTMAGNLVAGGNWGGGWLVGNAYGGGVYNSSGTIISVNDTFALNAAVGGTGGGTGYGGAICNSNGTVTLYNTVVANSTSGSNCSGTLSDGDITSVPMPARDFLHPAA